MKHENTFRSPTLAGTNRKYNQVLIIYC